MTTPLQWSISCLHSLPERVLQKLIRDLSLELRAAAQRSLKASVRSFYVSVIVTFQMPPALCNLSIDINDFKKMAITSEISLWFSFYALSHGMIRSVFSKKHTQINAYDWLSDIVYSL